MSELSQRELLDSAEDILVADSVVSRSTTEEEFGLTAIAVDRLHQARPWISLFAALGFLGSISFAILAFATLKEAVWGALFLGIVAALFSAGGLILGRFVTSLDRHGATNRTEHLERALLSQLRFWILCTLGPALLVAALVGVWFFQLVTQG